MRKSYLMFCVAMLVFSIYGFSQASELDPKAANNEVYRMKKAANAAKPKEDKSDVVEITAIGNISFVVSNITDGTVNAYNHSHLINVPVTTTAKNMNYQFVFYGVNEKFLYSVETEGSKTNIYYPISLYEDIKQKLEQSLNQKRKVVMKLVQKTDGYRECVLQF